MELSELELWLLKSPLSSADLRSIGDSFFASLAMWFIDYHFRITFVTLAAYEGDPTEKFIQALALLIRQMYSSNWAYLKALNIPFKWGYDTLISNNR